MKFTLESGRILLNSNNPEMGEANEEVAASFAGEGFSTGFNARYLLDALSVLEGEEATLEFKDSLSPLPDQRRRERVPGGGDADARVIVHSGRIEIKQVSEE
ncbi:MAG: hypothetical protein MPW14_13255 [Candidatus Manganitrophus sp.]|nr:MAG: hypothetical protein MPW14_13255 [Candidatus Manganitrophus sp.]